MKRIISIIAIIALLITLFTPIALSDSIDLSSMSWDELVALSAKINAELMSRPEFKEVTVPRGAYKVGEDIPAGKWTIYSCTGTGYIYWGKELDEYGINIASGKQIDHFRYWSEKDSITWNLAEGTYIIVDSSPVRFIPYTPQNLGF